MEQLFKERKERLDLFRSFRKKKEPQKKEVVDDLFIQCPTCRTSLYMEDLIKYQYVCANCGAHMKISAHERLRQVLDEGSFNELDRRMILKTSKFPDYLKKLESYQEKTGDLEAMTTGIGKIGGMKVAIGVMDSRFMMASMGSVVGEKCTRLIELATKKNLPLILFCASGGARMQEGTVALMQMAKTSAALKKFEKKGQVFISILTDPTTGGVSASFAMLGDVILAEPKALIGFAGKRVIEKTMNEKLPEEFQRAEFLLKKGFVDAIVLRKEMRNTLMNLLVMHKGASL